jgi:ATP-dependent helicase YprA (DUF1998 family)
VTELLPTVQAQGVQEGLLDYLTTTFALADADARRALTEFLTDASDGIFKGPYLRLRLPFRTADDGWQSALEWNGSFTPYGHQAEAFRRLTTVDLSPSKPRPRPTLVTTGTGSGKTEAFLYPILDHVLRERRAGRPGTKALILYPMNALANDQAARLARLITGHEELRGITAALYTGQGGPQRTLVSADGLITDRAVIRDEPPDILLSNYKMLDALLLRPEDQGLWARSALSLRYLVLDEFHTYDGAQGTDVAMLLRRLGFALKSHWPQPGSDGAPDEGARRRPLGLMTPVATSATLGDRGDPAAMVQFAATVFGEPFAESDVVTESRMSLQEWQAAPSGNDPEGLLAGIKSDSRVHRLLERCAAAVAVDDLSTAASLDSDETFDTEDILDLVAHLSHVRAGCGRAAPTVDLHLWVRELTRVDRIAASTTRYLWGDDGALAAGTSAAMGDSAGDPFSTEGRPAFPAVYCRHCGRSGWGVELAPTGNDLAADDTAIRRNHAVREGRFRALLSAPLEAEHSEYGIGNSGGTQTGVVEGLRWFSVKQRAVLTSPPPDDDPDFRDGWVLPVLALIGPDADEDSRRDTCPSCQQQDGIRFLGSAIATLLSVTLSTLFGAEGLDVNEKKALVFTDSVQDAAHRAGFVQSRSHVLTLRSVLRSAAGPDGSEFLSLDLLVDEALRQAGDSAFARYRLIAPDLVERKEFRPFWDLTPGVAGARARTRVRRRLLFDAVMEFGLNSRVGRTLEQTGSMLAEVSAPDDEVLASLGRAVLSGADAQDTLDGALGSITDRQLVAWVRGVLEHMRERGAVHHEWFTKYTQQDGNRFLISSRRHRGVGMPAFGYTRPTPAFPRTGPSLAVDKPLLDPVTPSQSWYARWSTRNLPVTAAHGGRLAKALLERLARADLLVATATNSSGTAYAIPAEAILVRPATLRELQGRDGLLECTVCRTQYPGTPTVVRQLDGAPCLLVRCPGALSRVARPDNYYRRLYASRDARRIVAREHSSLLPDDVRLAYETAFKQGGSDPNAPNVLVATPTLEMGIDIGDLSTVLLASLPRTVASYLQRVGRAGRLTGNALSMAFVTGRGEHLPRLGDPLSVVNGQVRPPATYLDAEEILRRQYVAHLVDQFARDPKRPHPRRAVAAIASAVPGTFLGELLAYAEAGTDRLLGAFLAAFEGQSDATVTALRAWATPTEGPGTSGLARHMFTASTQWTHAQEELQHRQTTIQTVLPDLEQKAKLPGHDDEDERAFNSARAALRLIRAQLAHRRTQPWIQALEEAGILPNYTLIDDGVSLDVALSWIDPDTQEFQSQRIDYRRPRAAALFEFAPGATFYAGGLEIAIDSVDLGVENSAVHGWAFCPTCGFARDRAPGGTAAPTSGCPRCGSNGILDAAQHLDVVELTRVTAEVRRDEAGINDRQDDRHRERFALFVAADVDPEAITRQWYLDGYDFGMKFLRRMDIRWINAGRGVGFGPVRTIGGVQRPAGLFRVCAGCGTLDRASGRNRRDEHRPWCPYRTSLVEHTRTLALTRTLTTQGVVLRLPSSVTIGDSFAVPSLAAGVLLGLHEQLGGTPDHIAVAAIADPTYTPSGDDLHDALLLHDIVPGGTGYLAELADPQRLWDLLHRAWDVVRTCPCQNEDRLACHRCLVPFAGPNLSVGLLSRQAAERHLQGILTGGTGTQPASADEAWTITDVPPVGGGTESHLEQHFRKVFIDRVKALGATVKEVPGPKGNTVRLTFPGGTRQWRLEPQVPMAGSQPDFVLQSNDPSVPEVALFTDGWFYHASLAHNRLADDARKRQDLRDSGITVLAITARDLEASAPTPQPPPWYDAQVASMLLSTDHYALSSRVLDVLTHGPIDDLMSWIHDPEVAARRRLADAAPMFIARAGQPTQLDTGADLAQEAAQRLTGITPAPAKDLGPGLWWQQGPIGVLVRPVSLAGTTAFAVAVVLDDRIEVIGTEEHREAWREWLRLANILGIRSQPLTVTTVSDALSGHGLVGSGTLAGSATARVDLIPARWRDALAGAVTAERDFLLELAALEDQLPVPVLGFETDDGIPIDLAWVDAKVAVFIEGIEDDRRDLEAAGWHILPTDADLVRDALISVSNTEFAQTNEPGDD